MKCDDEKKLQIDAHDGVQVNVAVNGSTVNASQNNCLSKTKIKFLKKNILKIVLSAIIVVLFCTIIIRYLNRYSIYNQYMNDAAYLKQNHSYLEAAYNYYNALAKAKKLILNQNLYVKAACQEADCYFLLALEEDDENISSQYYAKAGGIYGEIINNKKNKNTDFYVDALTGLSYVYNFTEHKMDKEWEIIIKQIDEEMKKRKKDYEYIQNSDDVDDALLYRWMRIYSALGYYYYAAIQTDYSFMYNPYITNTALTYYKKYDVLLDLARKKDIEVAMAIDPIYYDIVKAELMILIAESPWIKNPEQYAKQAIDVCQSYLNNASISIGKDVENYISLKSITANGYYILGEVNEKKGLKVKSDEYMKKAYEEMIVLLDMKNDKVQLEQIVNIGYNAIFTGFCSDEDIEKILDNYDKLLLEYNINEKPKELSWLALNICDACRGIINIYGYSERAWRMGKEIAENVMSIEEYIQKSQKDNFNEMYDFFTKM